MELAVKGAEQWLSTNNNKDELITGYYFFYVARVDMKQTGGSYDFEGSEQSYITENYTKYTFQRDFAENMDLDEEMPMATRMLKIKDKFRSPGAKTGMIFRNRSGANNQGNSFTVIQANIYSNSYTEKTMFNMTRMTSENDFVYSSFLHDFDKTTILWGRHMNVEDILNKWEEYMTEESYKEFRDYINIPSDIDQEWNHVYEDLMDVEDAVKFKKEQEILYNKEVIKMDPELLFRNVILQKNHCLYAHINKGFLSLHKYLFQKLLQNKKDYGTVDMLGNYEVHYLGQGQKGATIAKEHWNRVVFVFTDDVKRFIKPNTFKIPRLDRLENYSVPVAENKNDLKLAMRHYAKDGNTMFNEILYDQEILAGELNGRFLVDYKTISMARLNESAGTEEMIFNEEDYGEDPFDNHPYFLGASDMSDMFY